MVKMKKRFCFLILGMLLSIMLVTLSVSATGGGEAVVEDEAMEITWVGRIKSGADTTWMLQQIEEKFNAKIIPNGMSPNDQAEKINLMLSTGEFPDCGSVWQDPNRIYKEGVIRTIPKDIIKKYAPNYSRMLDEHPPGWMVYRNPDNKDEYLAITGIYEASHTNVWVMSVRLDYIKNVGFDLPDYEDNKVLLDYVGKVHYYNGKQDLDWWEKLLTAFKNGDPDGNGKNDSVPLLGWKNFKWTWSPLLGAYGIPYGGNLMDQGELYYWNIAPAYKDFLKLAARWYSKGLIDREYMNLGINQMRAKLLDRSGCVTTTPVYRLYADGSGVVAPSCLSTNEEAARGAEVICTPGPVGPKGDQGAYAYVSVSSLGEYPHFIGKHVSDEKLIRILQILDYMEFGSNEAFVNFFYGKPGVHFDWDGEPWDSLPIVRKPEDVPEGYPKDGAFFNIYPRGETKERIKFIYNTNLADFYNNFLLAEKGQKLSLRPYRFDLFTETELSDLWTKKGATLNSIHDEFYLNAVTGQIDIDAEWDNYVSSWRKNGGDELIAELKKAPIVSELLKGNTVY
jgi:ABC-type glycerol-3-phosphate transport system substrate-binding protein